MVAKLRLQRDELAAFLGDRNNAIRQFETLFAIADTVGVTGMDDLRAFVTALSAAAGQIAPPDERPPAAAVVGQPGDVMHAVAIPAQNVDFLKINQSPTAAEDQKIRWRSIDGALEYGANGTPIGIGFDAMVYVRNNTGSTIAKGAPVKIDTTISQLPAVSRASNSAPNTFFGVMASDMPTASSAYVQCSGLLRNVNATGAPFGEVWSSGQQIYLSATGLTNAAPIAPAYRVVVGTVVEAIALGSIMIQPGEARSLNLLADVNANPLAMAQLLMWNATGGFWQQGAVNAGTSIVLTPAVGVLTVGVTNVTNNQTVVIRSNVALANGAGALLGTLTNSPVAGPPSKWVTIDDNGTLRQIPAW
jgi:hypothetical protein